VFSLFLILLLFIGGNIQAQIAVKSWVDISEVVQESNQGIRLSVGNYNYNRMITFSGSGNAINFSDVYINVPVNRVGSIYLIFNQN